jgi:hypothetical protein
VTAADWSIICIKHLYELGIATCHDNGPYYVPGDEAQMAVFLRME